MTADEIINNSSPAVAQTWELPPLYKRINWAALLVPPIGVILLLLAAMYLFPYLKRRFGAKRAKKIYRVRKASAEKAERKMSESLNDISLERSEDFMDTAWDADSTNYSGTLDKLQSTPKHKLVTRITPTPSPSLGRLSISAQPPLASQEDLLF